ncbi:MAG TPA: hypothetical protein VH415_15150 [Nitrososphaeraceae archaeon]|jgi:hypothetical protein
MSSRSKGDEGGDDSGKKGHEREKQPLRASILSAGNCPQII